MLRPYCLEPVFPVLTGPKDAAQVEVRLNALLLDIIKALVIGLPDINLHVG